MSLPRATNWVKWRSYAWRVWHARSIEMLQKKLMWKLIQESLNMFVEKRRGICVTIFCHRLFTPIFDTEYGLIFCCYTSIISIIISITITSASSLLFLVLQPGFWKCWDVFFIWIKWKLKDFRVTWAHISFTIGRREHYKCLNGEMWHFYPLNELISNLMPATGLKKDGTGATKGWKSKTFWTDSAGRTSSN